MNRRELLKMIAILTGGSVIGGDFLLEGCTNPSAKTSTTFSEDDIAFLDEVGETILPATATPGAKAAHIGEFMRTIVNDCYDEDDQKTFHEGIGKLDDACKQMHHARFMNVRPVDRTKLFMELDKEAKEYQKKRNDFNKDQDEKEKAETAKGNLNFKKEKMPSHYFTMMKQLTLWGYFTSKEGMMQALNYVPVPGRYQGIIDYKKGDKLMVGLGG